MRRLATALAVLGVSLGMGCGRLSNEPFKVGGVRGVLLDADPSEAFVSVLGLPEQKASVDGEGRFELKDAPVGTVELFARASSTRAARFAVEVQGGQVTSAGSVAPTLGGFVTLRLLGPGGYEAHDGKGWIEGLPYERREVGEDEPPRFGPLAAGCYTARGHDSELGETTQDFCIASGEEKVVAMTFGGLAMCEACAHDDECGGLEGRCESVGDAGRICVSKCSGDSSACAPGFSCQGDRCLPDPAFTPSCVGYRAMGTSCSGDAECQTRGIVNGVCRAGQCTHACGNDHDCPSGFDCEATFCEARGP
jgi:hypothetical protein